MVNSFRFAVFIAACAPFAVHAGGSGTLSLSNPALTYSGGPYLLSKPKTLTAALTGNVPRCASGNAVCDVYDLTVALPADYATTHPGSQLSIVVGWVDPSANFDVYVYDGSGAKIAQATSSTDPEIVRVPTLGGTHKYQVQTVPNFPQAQSIAGQITLDPGPPPGSTATLGGPVLELLPVPAAFQLYDAGEPTIGVTRADDNAFMMLTNNALKVSFNDVTSPANTVWSDITDANSENPSGTEDPFITVDAFPRDDGTPSPLIVAAQLHGTTSIISKTKDEGQTWKTTLASGLVNGEDHEAIFIGPYPAGLRPKTALAEHALYYCSHALANAFCSRSDNGGLTFNPGVPIWPPQVPDLMYSSHGMVKVGADGTVYVPAGGGVLGGGAALTLSTDAGLTWHFVTVPHAASTYADPSLAIASDGKTIYYALTSFDDGHVYVIKGVLDKTKASNPTIVWDARGLVRLDAPAGLSNTAFPAVIAGDPDRAAVAFHGTTTPGFANDVAGMANAAWYLYVASTYDGGKTWQVSNAMPGDPVQRGAICMGGLTAGCGMSSRPPDRNLKDFIHATLDSHGRLLVAFADGCTDACVPPGGIANYDRRGTIARLVGGKPFYARFDSQFAEPAAPKAPLLQGTRSRIGVRLTWSQPYPRGSAVTGYKIYRSIISGKEAYLGQTAATTYNDATATDPNADYFYRVTALNGIGESAASNEFAPKGQRGSPCALPGVIVTDGGDNTGGFNNLGLSLQYIGIGEPYFDGAKDAIVFTIKVDTLKQVPPQFRWAVIFNTPATTTATPDFVAMTSEGSGVQFTYGQLGFDVGPVGVYSYATLGKLDPSSTYGASGEIVLVLPRSALPGLAPGNSLTGIYARITNETAPASAVPSQATAGVAEIDADAPYPLVGNAFCKP